METILSFLASQVVGLFKVLDSSAPSSTDQALSCLNVMSGMFPVVYLLVGKLEWLKEPCKNAQTAADKPAVLSCSVSTHELCRVIQMPEYKCKHMLHDSSKWMKT